MVGPPDNRPAHKASLNPHNLARKEAIHALPSQLYRRGNWGRERLSNFPKATQSDLNHVVLLQHPRTRHSAEPPTGKATPDATCCWIWQSPQEEMSLEAGDSSGKKTHHQVGEGKLSQKVGSPRQRARCAHEGHR